MKCNTGIRYANRTATESERVNPKNARLLKFAGIVYREYEIAMSITERGWYLNGKRIGKNSPDLYNDIASQVKYLWPKLNCLDLHKVPLFNGERYEAQAAGGSAPGWLPVHTDANPAHAIAEATLAFLDSKEKDNANRS